MNRALQMFLTFYCIVLYYIVSCTAVNCRVKSEERAVTAGRAEVVASGYGGFLVSV